MSTFFKVRTGQNRGITGVSAVDSTVRVGKRIISVKAIGFYIVSPVGKVIIEDEYDIAVAESAYKEYVDSGRKSTPVQDFWRELDEEV